MDRPKRNQEGGHAESTQLVKEVSVVSGPLSVVKKHKARGMAHGAKSKKTEIRGQKSEDR